MPPQGGPSELYDLKADPEQLQNVIAEQPAVVQQLRQAWLDFLASHNAPETRLRPFVEGDVALATPTSGKLYAFRDDQGQWIAHATEAAARHAAYHEAAPGPQRDVDEISFGALLDNNAKNLVYLYGQYYWAEDLA